MAKKSNDNAFPERFSVVSDCFVNETQVMKVADIVSNSVCDDSET